VESPEHAVVCADNGLRGLATESLTAASTSGGNAHVVHLKNTLKTNLPFAC